MVEEDLLVVAQLESELFSDGWSEESLRSSLAQDFVKMFVAESEGQGVLGYHIFYTSFDEGDVARIAVIPSCRRMGIAEQLLDCAWNYCKETGIVRVLLEVRQGNIGAISLYEKQGFETLGIRKGYYQEPLEDGVIMEKRLDITTSN